MSCTEVGHVCACVQLESALQSVNCGYRQVWGVSQLLAQRGFGSQLPAARNVALLCGDGLSAGMMYPPHCAGSAALLQLFMAQVCVRVCVRARIIYVQKHLALFSQLYFLVSSTGLHSSWSWQHLYHP